MALPPRDGKKIEGLYYSRGDPGIAGSTGGLMQLIPANRIKNSEFLANKSLMLSADLMGLAAQDVADLVAFLKRY